MSALAIGGIAAAGAAALFVILFVVPTMWLKVRRVRSPLGLGKKALHISDVHVERLRVSPQRLVSVIEREKPDYIFLTGDYTEKPRYLGKVDVYLRAIASTGIPAFAVLGNHDYRLKGRLERLLQLFRHYGIPVLRNESLDLGPFRLVGIDDDCSRKSDIGKAFRDTAPDDATVVITHDPNVTLKIGRPYGYLLCGHFHGGQFRLPFLRHFLQKGPLGRKGILQGTHKDANGTFYISTGLGQAGVNLRLFIRSEVTVHEL
ncbi:metallophosphoesterase [Paenibacillus thermotolerans]|uniref:metallophosphoesterase n=1 Tax=Paenibacillus thermotolerans TaxID=3027807 RepID=UPI0023689F3B|nr:MULTISPECIES: metallophosphoesterase [unclassified Paenibacillus]